MAIFKGTQNIMMGERGGRKLAEFITVENRPPLRLASWDQPIWQQLLWKWSEEEKEEEEV